MRSIFWGVSRVWAHADALPVGFNTTAVLLLLLVLYRRAHFGEQMQISASQTSLHTWLVLH